MMYIVSVIFDDQGMDIGKLMSYLLYMNQFGSAFNLITPLINKGGKYLFVYK